MSMNCLAQERKGVNILIHKVQNQFSAQNRITVPNSKVTPWEVRCGSLVSKTLTNEDKDPDLSLLENSTASVQHLINEKFIYDNFSYVSPDMVRSSIFLLNFLLQESYTMVDGKLYVNGYLEKNPFENSYYVTVGVLGKTTFPHQEYYFNFEADDQLEDFYDYHLENELPTSLNLFNSSLHTNTYCLSGQDLKISKLDGETSSRFQYSVVINNEHNLQKASDFYSSIAGVYYKNKIYPFKAEE